MPGSTVLPAGTRLAHYEVRSVLGTGGMGTVYLAHDTALDRPVAVKVLHAEIGEDPVLRDRFVREARAAARVSHANLTHVHFVGEADGRPYFAMEYCPGSTLEAAVREKGPFPLDRGLDVLEQAARGLAAAHGAGVVHRDVKPSNLMLLPDGSVKVTDFGLAKSLSGDVAATAGRILGTPTYMSPEQVRGKPVDARTDIYLLGLTAWTVFAGRPPFASDQVGEVINDQMNSRLPDLHALRPDLSPALGKALDRLCAKEPAERPATMEEVAGVFRSLRPRPIHPAPIVARGVAASVDGVVLLLLLLLTWAVVGVAIHGWRNFQVIGEMAQNPLFQAVLSGLFYAAVIAGEAVYGSSPGKLLLGMAVVRPDGTRPALRQVVLRSLIRFPIFLDVLPEGRYTMVSLVLWGLQALTVAAGLLCYLFSQGRTLTDLLTRTRVVYNIRSAARDLP